MIQIIDRYGYDQCISLAAKLDQIVYVLESVENIEEEYLDEDEYETIMELSQQVMLSADMIRHKAQSYATKEVE
jgi:hypothetical protein